MPRMATLAEHRTSASSHTPAGSVPPPTTTAASQGSGPDELTEAQAEALARVATLAAASRSAGDRGPSRAILGAVVALALMLAAIGLLAIVLSLG